MWNSWVRRSYTSPTQNVGDLGDIKKMDRPQILLFSINTCMYNCPSRTLKSGVWYKCSTHRIFSTQMLFQGCRGFFLPQWTPRMLLLDGWEVRMRQLLSWWQRMKTETDTQWSMGVSLFCCKSYTSLLTLLDPCVQWGLHLFAGKIALVIWGIYSASPYENKTQIWGLTRDGWK